MLPHCRAQAELPADVAAQYAGRQLLLLEVTVPVCNTSSGASGNSSAAAAGAQCEQELLSQRLEALVASSVAKQAWEVAGGWVG